MQDFWTCQNRAGESACPTFAIFATYWAINVTGITTAGLPLFGVTVTVPE